MIDVHLVSHTHWDREWYLTREQFRLRLVDLVDRVLDLLQSDSGYACFHLDGQTIVLEDYLEINPDRADEIRALVRAGRLLVGPWYVMPDEFLVSGESLVRNLALGHSIARAFGGSMPVGYLPDLFGHVGQMPQILRQFGLDNAILWRGFGGPQAEYWWESPDGSRVLMMHLPTEGYCNATRVALVPDAMVARTEAVIERESKRTRYDVVLLMNGVDHIEPQASIPALVEALNGRQHHVRHSTLPAYVDAVRAGASRDGASLEVIRGELRGGEQYAPLLPGVLSARTYLKRANAEVQTALERWAEPLSALAWMLGDRYPAAALQYAWKVLLQNHPHDSICGCSIDAVHEENVSRFARARQVAEDLIERASVSIARRASRAGAGSIRVLFFNTSGFPTKQVVHGVLDIPFGNAEPQRHVDPEALDAPVVFYPEGSTIVGAALPDGTAVPVQVLDESNVISWVMSRFETPWALHARRVRFAATLDLPACGYSSLDLRIGTPGAARPRFEGVRVTGTVLENAVLRVSVQSDGTATITDKRSGREYPGCGALVDEGDVGDEYNYSPPAEDRVFTSRDLRDVSISSVSDGPVHGAIRIDATLDLPQRAAPDRRSRVNATVPLRVTTVISLDADASRAVWTVRIENRAEDHRLRIAFPAGLNRVVEATADTAFGLISRPARRERPATVRTELPVDASPLLSLVACPEPGGAAVFVRGLNEYEILDAENAPRIAITLLRCVGDLSRDDLATRPHGHAGPGLSTPGAQCPGEHTFTVAFEPLAAAPAPDSLYASAFAVTAPPRMAVADAAGQGLPTRLEFLSLTPAGGAVVLSALKKTDARDSLCMRIFNPGAEPAAVDVTVAGGIREGSVSNLLEEPLSELRVAGEAVRVDVSAFAVRTMQLIPARRPLRPEP